MENLLVRYARQSTPPEARAQIFISGETRLTWVSLFYSDFPNAEIYLVGGTLRDAILGKIPSDVDIVVRNIEPKKLESWLCAHGACDYVGRNFGTFKFTPHGAVHKEPIDIALPRTEKIGDDHVSGRRDMEVQSDYRLSIKDDLSRRDFTVNAMALELRMNRLIDPFRGLQDLMAGIIRAVNNPKKRFEEDATRMLRGLRFSSQLNFGIEENTWRAIQEKIEKLNNIRLTEDGKHEYAIAREMIGKEFLLGFVVHAEHTLDLWEQSGALKLFMPEVSGLSEVLGKDGESKLEKTKKVLHLLHTKTLLNQYGKCCVNPTLLVAALFTFIEDKKGKEAHKICNNLFFHQFPQAHKASVDCKNVLWLLDNLRMFDAVDPASIKPSQFEKTFLGQRGSDLLILMHATFIAEGKHSVARERLHSARRIQKRMQEFVGGGFDRLISGSDISELGVESGPVYRELIDNIRDAQLTEKIKTPREAKRMLGDLVNKL